MYRERVRVSHKGVFLLLFFTSVLLTDCTREEQETEKAPTVLIFKHGKTGEPDPLKGLLLQFERENPGIRVRDEVLPSSSDEQHQYYVINLEGGNADFDVISIDVVWISEFARAGWLRNLTQLLPAKEQADFFPGVLEAVRYDGDIYALPWFMDAGILYYRKDILQRYKRQAPATWEALVEDCRFITASERDIYGFVWQGKQYEGLVCNTLEYVHSNNGGIVRDGRVIIDSRKNIQALRFMRELIADYKVSPPLVTNAVEETTRHIFGSGKALFMRNWPYAWEILQQPDSPVAGKVGLAPLPAFPGGSSAPTLGGWHLGVSSYSRHPREAERLAVFLTSAASQKVLALTIGYKPARKSLYRDRELLEKQPFLPSLYNIFLTARPRPVSPYYMMMTQVMQPEFSAAISGIKTPEQALKSAKEQIEHILELEREQ